MSYLPASGVPDEIYIGPTQPSPPVDIWIDTDEPGGTTNAYVLKSGSTMTGTLDVPTITSTVDDIKLGTHINAQNNTIWGLRNPPTGGDWAVTKDYVDSRIYRATFTKTTDASGRVFVSNTEMGTSNNLTGVVASLSYVGGVSNQAPQFAAARLESPTQISMRIWSMSNNTTGTLALVTTAVSVTVYVLAW